MNMFEHKRQLRAQDFGRPSLPAAAAVAGHESTGRAFTAAIDTDAAALYQG
jgi:hypothetical protein